MAFDDIVKKTNGCLCGFYIDSLENRVAVF